MEPTDQALYAKTKKQVYKKHPKHSAYRSGILVQTYKTVSYTHLTLPTILRV